ncbi:hypothetical protein ACJMK2_015611 [Sinanodonta woodiana]|uniref:Uncharacterized protein n=1 Tax=Sinanodonta woodiana TaxID=1069815 RepID=A0ABD3UQX2_SINWO
MPKRKSLTANFKSDIIKFAKEPGNRAAGREFRRSEKNVCNSRLKEISNLKWPDWIGTHDFVHVKKYPDKTPINIRCTLGAGYVQFCIRHFIYAKIRYPFYTCTHVILST